MAFFLEATSGKIEQFCATGKSREIVCMLFGPSSYFILNIASSREPSSRALSFKSCLFGDLSDYL